MLRTDCGDRGSLCAASSSAWRLLRSLTHLHTVAAQATATAMALRAIRATPQAGRPDFWGAGALAVVASVVVLQYSSSHSAQQMAAAGVMQMLGLRHRAASGVYCVPACWGGKLLLLLLLLLIMQS